MSDGKAKFVMSKSEPFISNTKENIWSAGIHLPYKDNYWLSQIECYGSTKEEAEKLRDKVFDAMDATAQPASVSRDVRGALERELRVHVAGMQCAIDNCGISSKERDAAAKYAMDNIGEWKRLLSEYANSLSRAAKPARDAKGSE